MHTKTLLIGVLAAASVVATQEPHLVARDGSDTITAASGEPTRTKHHHKDKDQALETEDPVKVSKYRADMKSLHSSIRQNPMFTSMKGAFKTAIPQTYKDAMTTNPASLNSQYKSVVPPWYSSLPADVRSFMEANQKAASSIRDKDLGPNATNSPHGIPGTEAAAANKDAKKSEASGLGLIGATVGTLAGALGVALLLL